MRNSASSSDSATCSNSSRDSRGRPSRSNHSSSPISPRMRSSSSSARRRTSSAVIGVPSSVRALVAHPLPHLRAGDLRRGGVLHQPVDARPRRCRAATSERYWMPTLTSLRRPASVIVARRRGDVEQLGRRRPARRRAGGRPGWAGRPAPRRSTPWRWERRRGARPRCRRSRRRPRAPCRRAPRRSRARWPPGPCGWGSAPPSRPSRARRAGGRSSPAARCRRA